MTGNGTFLNNIDLIVDLAEELRRDQPYEAYVLLKLAQSARPKGQRIAHLLQGVTPAPMQDTVVAWRHDGLCERLAAILIGLHTAKALNLDFRIVWPNESFLQDHFKVGPDAGHDVPADPSMVLSEHLIADHLIDRDEILHPSCDFSFLHSLSNRITLNSFGKAVSQKDILRPFWLASNRSFADLEDAFSPDDLRASFINEIVSDDVRNAIREAESISLPSPRVALHVRGGDIVYGATRLSHGFGRVKSIPLPVADKICDFHAARGCTVIAFGATKSDLRDLSERHANVRLVSDFDQSEPPGHCQVIRDVFLMSRCDEIISSRDSAVPKLAALLGRATFVSVNDLFDLEAEREILAASIKEAGFGALPPLQKAFIFWSLFVTSADVGELETRLGYLMKAYETDPENPRYPAFAILVELLLRRFDDADRTLDLLFRNHSAPEAPRSLDGFFRDAGIWIVNPMLLEIERSRDLPERWWDLLEPSFRQISAGERGKNRRMPRRAEPQFP